MLTSNVGPVSDVPLDRIPVVQVTKTGFVLLTKKAELFILGFFAL